MRVLISIAHPATVHLFKNTIFQLIKDNIDYLIISRNKDVTNQLLNYYSFKYITISNHKNGLLNLLYEYIIRTIRTVSIIKEYNPDIIISELDPSISLASKIKKIRYLPFCDTEHAKINIYMSLPFVNNIYTPASFNKNFGKRQVRYNGCHELAYLHPNYYSPNDQVLDILSISDNDKFIILRFVSWGASHDMMQKGIDNKISLVKELEKICKVFITSEGPLPKQLEPYKIHIPPELMHDALYYASLYIGEGGTMASECAVLGTPAIYVNSLPLGYLNEQQDNYKLIKIMNEYDENLLISYAIELISDTNIKLSKKASQRYIRDNIDVTAFMVNTIQNIELPQINK